MTLGNIRDHIYRATKTNSSGWGSSLSDMAIALNSWQNYVDAIMRAFNSEYASTAFSGSDISTGTIVPKFNVKYHEILPLGVELDYAGENALTSQNNKAMRFRMLESEMRRWYAARQFKVATITIAAPGVVTLDNHGFNTNDRVIFETSGALPTGLTSDTVWYYVIYKTEHTFSLAATRDGAAITTSGSQSGTHFLGIEKRPRLKSSSERESCE